MSNELKNTNGMTGAQSLIDTLVASGVDTCFANPGTSEIHMVQAIDNTEGMRPVLTLFEGVAAGAADGYGRMTGKPACTLLHLGPGMANGISQLHNAFRARTPLVNIVGDHAISHRGLDAPLASDIEGYARPFSGWLRTARSADSLGQDAADAVAAAHGSPGRIATLIVPADCAWSPAVGRAKRFSPHWPLHVDGERIREAAEALGRAKNPLLMLSGAALDHRGLIAAGRIAETTGAKLYRATFNGRYPRGAGRVPTTPMPGYGERGVKAMANVDVLVLVAANPPVSFFAYPGRPTTFVPEGCREIVLAEPGHNAVEALEALADEIGAAVRPRVARFEPPDRPTGELTAGAVGQAIAHFLPEHAIICDESMSARAAVAEFTSKAAPHDWLELTGGALGGALPLSVGASIACPDRPVICLHGDGGAMYTVQALWSHARETLDITTVIFSNRRYDALYNQFDEVGLKDPGPRVAALFDLKDPDLEWPALAEGMGVRGLRATTADEFAAQFADCLAQPGPGLIEVVL